MTTTPLKTISPADITLSVINAEFKINAARGKCWVAKNVAEKIMNDEERVHEKVLSELLEKFQEKAKELATAERSCPRERWGGYMEPSNITVQEDGLNLSWDINGDYAPAHFLASWESLLENKSIED